MYFAVHSAEARRARIRARHVVAQAGAPKALDLGEERGQLVRGHCGLEALQDDLRF